MLKMFFKSLLYSSPVALVIGLMGSDDLALKIQKYPAYEYSTIIDLIPMCTMILFCAAIIFISIPVFLAIKSDTKYKVWIITLDMLCFFPFGGLFYLVSLAWAIFEIVKSTTKHAKTKNIKSEIVNNEQFLNLKKAERIKYLQELKKQTLVEITKLQKEIEKELNKYKDMPADVVKYVKRKKNTMSQNRVLDLEDKIVAIDELIKSETEKTKKKRTSEWQNYLDDDDL